MRILRLTNSNDLLSTLPPEALSSAVADRVVAEITGVTPETIVRAVWPGPELPGIIQRWLLRYEPDLVFLRAASYWVTYESVPLRVQRQLGAMGSWPSRAGFAVGGNPKFASNQAFKALRRLALRTVGGTTYFTPDEATKHVEAVLRQVLTQESVLAVVRGPGHTYNAVGDATGLRVARRRIDEFEARLSDLCQSLHVPYCSTRLVADDPALLQADGVHDNAEGQRIFGELEGKAIAAAWQAATLRP